MIFTLVGGPPSYWVRNTLKYVHRSKRLFLIVSPSVQAIHAHSVWASPVAWASWKLLPAKSSLVDFSEPFTIRGMVFSAGPKSFWKKPAV